MTAPIFTRPPIDWSQPIEWDDGSPAEVLEEILPTDRTVAVILGDQYPKAIDAMMNRKHFKDHIVVRKDTGVPAVGLGEYAPDCHIRNTNYRPSEIERLYGTF